MSVKPEDIISSVVTFLRKELGRDTLNSEAKEGVEVAVECLCKAYDIPDTIDTNKTVNLEALFEDHFKDEASVIYNSINFVPTEEAKRKAEEYKNLGNAAMQQDKPDVAILQYSKAIDCDNSNPVYYCNRAASHNKLKNNKLALRDCQVAIKIDPSYAKAYGRMGLAYTQMNNFQAALESYVKAAELDPDDPLYANNVQAAMGNVCNPPDPTDLTNKILSDGSIQQLLSNIMSPTAQGQDGASNSGIQALLTASQQMAEQFEQRNPQLVEQILQQFGPAMSHIAQRNNPPADGSSGSNP